MREPRWQKVGEHLPQLKADLIDLACHLVVPAHQPPRHIRSWRLVEIRGIYKQCPIAHNPNDSYVHTLRQGRKAEGGQTAFIATPVRCLVGPDRDEDRQRRAPGLRQQPQEFGVSAGQLPTALVSDVAAKVQVQVQVPSYG